jgi:hypothetical protein
VWLQLRGPELVQEEAVAVVQVSCRTYHALQTGRVGLVLCSSSAKAIFCGNDTRLPAEVNLQTWVPRYAHVELQSMVLSITLDMPRHVGVHVGFMRLMWPVTSDIPHCRWGSRG